MSSFDTPIPSSPPNPSSGSGTLAPRAGVGRGAACGLVCSGSRECLWVSCMRNETNRANMLRHVNMTIPKEMILSASKMWGIIWDLSLVSISISRWGVWLCVFESVKSFREETTSFVSFRWFGNWWDGWEKKETKVLGFNTWIWLWITHLYEWEIES